MRCHHEGKADRIRREVRERGQYSAAIAAIKEIGILTGLRVERSERNLKSDWERSNHSKIRNVPGNAELSCDVEQGPGPYDCAETDVNGA